MLVKTNTIVVDPTTAKKFECIVCRQFVDGAHYDHETQLCTTCKKEGKS